MTKQDGNGNDMPLLNVGDTIRTFEKHTIQDITHEGVYLSGLGMFGKSSLRMYENPGVLTNVYLFPEDARRINWTIPEKIGIGCPIDIQMYTGEVEQRTLRHVSDQYIICVDKSGQESVFGRFSGVSMFHSLRECVLYSTLSRIVV